MSEFSIAKLYENIFSHLLKVISVETVQKDTGKLDSDRALCTGSICAVED